MAKKAKRSGGKRRSRKSKGLAGKKVLAHHGYGGRKFGCYGKRVRAGRSTKKVARIFCAVDKKK